MTNNALVRLFGTYQLLTSLDLNTQGEPRNCGNNGYQELTLTSAQRKGCIYCNRKGLHLFLGLTTAPIVSVIVEEFQPNAQQCLGQIVWYNQITGLDLNDFKENHEIVVIMVIRNYL